MRCKIRGAYERTLKRLGNPQKSMAIFFTLPALLSSRILENWWEKQTPCESEIIKFFTSWLRITVETILQWIIYLLIKVSMVVFFLHKIQMNIWNIKITIGQYQITCKSNTKVDDYHLSGRSTGSTEKKGCQYTLIICLRVSPQQSVLAYFAPETIRPGALSRGISLWHWLWDSFFFKGTVSPDILILFMMSIIKSVLFYGRLYH